MPCVTDLPHVLAVDDDESYLLLLERTLTKNGLRVSSATSGEKGVALAESHPPHAILLDIVMPGMDGYETCRRLKANPRTRDIPIIFMTAQGRTDEHLAQAYSVGGCGYITKPLSRVETIAHVRSIIEHQYDMMYAQRLQMYDELTGLPDIRYVRARTDEELSEASRFGTPVSVTMADLDQFTRLNRDRGTEAGDLVLKRFATLLRSEIRHHDIVARWKSARFLLLLPRISSEGGSAVAHRICNVWRLSGVPEGDNVIQSTASFGVATYKPEHPRTTAGALIEQAEVALGQAKDRGGARVAVADAKTDAAPMTFDARYAGLTARS